MGGIFICGAHFMPKQNDSVTGTAYIGGTALKERFIILLATAVLAVSFSKAAWVIWPVGTLLLLGSILKPARGSESPTDWHPVDTNAEADFQTGRGRQMPEPDPSLFGQESDEDYLARMRYSEYCEEHHLH
jgi:hypothetical protein